jgi:hypothetical protein
MMREYHVRICEGLGVKFPGPTLQNPTSNAVANIHGLDRLWTHRGRARPRPLQFIVALSFKFRGDGTSLAAKQAAAFMSN